MTGAEYIAAFLSKSDCRKVMVETGGAATFMIDAAARRDDLALTYFVHEQSAAMAADAVWRVTGKVGATIATSGPGATNLITGIASSYFDSIPALHITGQVNQREMAAYQGTRVRQMGFQETRIVEMVQSITKRAVMVRTADELREELARCHALALDGRKGPVLIDVPMDIQQIDVGDSVDVIAPAPPVGAAGAGIAAALTGALTAARRPLVLIGAGVGLAGVQAETMGWLAKTGLPFVASWGGMPYFNHALPGYCGQIGVYGNRGANFVLQNCDLLIVLGSRLDNRQRSNNAANFAKDAVVHVLDVDSEELKKYAQNGYASHLVDFANLPGILAGVAAPAVPSDWRTYTAAMKQRYFAHETSTHAARSGSLCPYAFIRRMRDLVDTDAVVVADTGAAVCWLHQAFDVAQHTLFTAAGNSPMGYALPAAIGAKLAAPDRQVISYNGDGGFQLNLQDLQTVRNAGLDIKFVVMNNNGYGIIRQFQDAYLGGRYFGSSIGYGNPDFAALAQCYGLAYARIEKLDDLTGALFNCGPVIIEAMIDEAVLIEPKMEMGRPINDQFPYMSDAEYAEGNRFVAYPR